MKKIFLSVPLLLFLSAVFSQKIPELYRAKRFIADDSIKLGGVWRNTWPGGGGGGGVASVLGTTNRITSTGGANPVLDISATFESLFAKLAANQTFTGSNIFSKDISVNGIKFGLGNFQHISNTAAGRNALNSTITATNATALGNTSAQNTTTGVNFVSIGSEAGFSNISGSWWTAVGYQAARSNLANAVTAIGNAAGYSNTTGHHNIYIEAKKNVNLTGVTTGSNNIIIGNEVGSLSPTLHNTIILKEDSAGVAWLVKDSSGTATVTGGDIRYSTNYGSLFTNRSLPDKRYIDSSISAAIAGGGGAAAWGAITGTLSAQTDLQTALNLKANLASPALTGTPTAPTPAAGDNSTKIATTAFAAGLLNDSAFDVVSPVASGGVSLFNKVSSTKLQIKKIRAGTNLTLTDNADSTVTIDATGGGGTGVDTLWTVSHNANSKTLRNVKGIDVSIPGGANTYATWNPADKAAGITLSGGNLVATTSGGALELVRGTVGVSSGKWYWEITVTTGGSLKIGVAKSTESLSSYLGSGVAGYAYADDGQKWNNATSASYGATLTTGDVVGVALDMDAGTLIFYKNGASQGTAFTGLTGTYYPAVSGGFSAVVYTANFGATAFSGSVPGGYNSGIYTTGGGGTPVFETDSTTGTTKIKQALALQGKQNITSGTATTLTSNIVYAYVNPGSVLASHTITMPASPVEGQEVRICFGGTIAIGAAVVTTLTISPNTGQALYQASTPTTANGGDVLIYNYNATNAKWYRLK